MINQIQSGRWDRALRRLFGVKEPGSIAPALSPEVLPVAVLQPHEPELYFLKGERLSSAVVTAAATPGNYSYVEFASRTGALCVMESITIGAVGTNEEIFIGWDNNAVGGNPAFGSFRDSRLGTTSAAALNLATVFYGASAAFISTNTHSRWQFGGMELHVETPFVIANGARLLVERSSVNLVLEVSFTWRERPMEEMERGP